MKLDHERWCKGREPTRDYTCPVCKAVFRAPGTWRAGRIGKVCPAGHFHTVNQLVCWEKNGRLSQLRQRKVAAPKQPDVKPIAAPKPVERALASMGVGERTSQLSVALRWMLEGYAKAISSMPEKSMARQLVEGAFGKTPIMAKDLLDGPPPDPYHHG